MSTCCDAPWVGDSGFESSPLRFERIVENFVESLDLMEPDLSGFSCSLESDVVKTFGDSPPWFSGVCAEEEGSCSNVSLLRGETVREEQMRSGRCKAVK